MLSLFFSYLFLSTPFVFVFAAVVFVVLLLLLFDRENTTGRGSGKEDKEGREMGASTEKTTFLSAKTFQRLTTWPPFFAPMAALASSAQFLKNWSRESPEEQKASSTPQRISQVISRLIVPGAAIFLLVDT